MLFAHEATNLLEITHGVIHLVELVIPVFIFTVGLFLIRKYIRNNKSIEI